MKEMSPAEANAAKTADSLAITTPAALLNWDVFVTPGIPIVTPDAPTLPQTVLRPYLLA